jgi:hypothetical protein
MIEKVIIFGVVGILFVLAIWGWYLIEKKIKKNIKDMDL